MWLSLCCRASKGWLTKERRIGGCSPGGTALQLYKNREFNGKTGAAFPCTRFSLRFHAPSKASFRWFEKPRVIWSGNGIPLEKWRVEFHLDLNPFERKTGWNRSLHSAKYFNYPLIRRKIPKKDPAQCGAFRRSVPGVRRGAFRSRSASAKGRPERGIPVRLRKPGVRSWQQSRQKDFQPLRGRKFRPPSFRAGWTFRR